MAALEAVATGAPVVAADLGGIPEAVGACGLLFPPGDAQAFATNVLSVLTQPELPRQLGAGRRDHVERFDWKVIVRECLDFYDEVLG
jgi:D-inositol-3-phosphate glycosyltransferase